MKNIKSLLLCFYDHNGCYDESHMEPSDIDWALNYLLDDDYCDEYQRLFAIFEDDECPYCARKKPIPDETDLETLCPEIAKEWDYESNGDLTPIMVTAHSNKKVWWVCEKGHKWEASIENRARGHSCPYCTGRKPIPGEIDLATLFPDVAKEWDYEKNGEVTPVMVTARSNKKVWWVCEKAQHHWYASIDKRTGGRGCPYCSGQRKYKPTT